MPLSSTKLEESRVTFFHADTGAAYKIKLALNDLIVAAGTTRDNLVVLCIGTDRSTGDCLGPLVGSRLRQWGAGKHQVLGTLKEPVHALNLETTMQKIFDRNEHSFIIAVDACLGKADRVGYINVRGGALQPGTALKKVLPPVGHVHLSGVVNVAGFMEHLVLQNTRLGLVNDMAEVIAWGILGVLL